jgi:exonuclease V gamma subunit
MDIRSSHCVSMTDMGDELAKIIAEGSASLEHVFRKEVILVDGKAMSNWLTHYLVRDADTGKGKGLGIHANAELMNTQRFSPWALAIIRGDSTATKSPDPLADLEFRTHALLCEPKSELAASFADAVGNPEHDGGMARWEAARKIAERIKELLLDDPLWVKETEENPRSGGRLEAMWRALRATIKATDGLITPYDIMKRLVEDPKACAKVAAQLPGRITLLATGDVPRTLLRSLHAIAKNTPVTVRGIFLQPTYGYHLDVNATKLDGLKTPGATFLRSTAEHFREQFGKLLEDEQLDWGFGGGAAQEDGDGQTAPTLLKALQSGIRDFESDQEFDLSGESAGSPSICINRCHSALREVEALKDEILGAIKNSMDEKGKPGIKPRDILILTPDPETYAPLIKGVFKERTPSIYVTTVAVAGTGKSALTALSEKILTLPAGRLTSVELLEFLELKVVRDVAGWDAEDLEDIREWITGAPFYWGADADHRKRLTGHEFGEWSLKDFMARIALGTAVPDSIELAGDPASLPLNELEGKQDLQRAAEFIAHANRIRTWYKFSQETHPGAEWALQLAAVIKSFMPDSRSYQEERAKMEAALAKMIEQANQGPVDKIPLALFSAQALPCLDLDHGKGQFMSGGAVVAPLRSSCIHPAKIVALIGMNDGAFPARGTRPGPEIETKNETKTKREAYQREQRGMHAILLAIGAAHEKLIVSFQGYAGASGKEASAALPVEMLRLACEAITEGNELGFKVRRHGIMSHEQGHESDKDIPVKQTYDKAGALVANTIEKDIKPNEIIALSEKTTQHWTLDQWLSFWTDPIQETFKAYDARAIWLESAPPENEPLVGVDGSATEKTKDKWVTEYRKRTGISPSWETALKLSGQFAQDDAVIFKKLVKKAEKPEMTGECDWKKVISDTFGIPADFEEVTGIQSRQCDIILTQGDWAFACLSESESIKDATPFLALLLLGLAQKAEPKIKHLAILERKPLKNKLSCQSRFIETRDVKVADPKPIIERLAEAAKASLNNEIILSNRVFDTACKAFMCKDGDEPDESALFGKGYKDQGDSGNSYARLVMPPRYKFEKLMELVRKNFSNYRWQHNLNLNNGLLETALANKNTDA